MLLQNPPKTGVSVDINDRIIRFAAELEADCGGDFASDRKLKDKVAARLRRLLPPWPRRAGRPDFPNVTKAIRLHGEIQREHPKLSAKQVWQRVYPQVIPDWKSLSLLQRREKRDWLQERINWRRKAVRRRARKAHRYRSRGKLQPQKSPL